MHHEFGYARGEQGEDSEERCAGTIDETGEEQGYEGAEECHGRAVEHDTLGRE